MHCALVLTVVNVEHATFSILTHLPARLTGKKKEKEKSEKR